MEIKNDDWVAIIGQGYVGLPLAITLVNSGWNVLGIDADEEKINSLQLGISPVADVRNEDIVNAIKSGAYKPSSRFENIKTASVVVICVPTPLDKYNKPDLSFLINASQSIGRYISDRTLIISESTSFPGTLRSIVVPEIYKNTFINNAHFYFAVSPERVNPGDTYWNQKNTPRLVAGLDTEDSIQAISFYKSFSEQVMEVESPEIAEAAKLLENTFRLINISMINEFAQLCTLAGLDINSVIDAASTKPYGFMQFRPGPGIGGHCIPVDPVYLLEWSKNLGGRLYALDCALEQNQRIPKVVADRLINLIGNLYGKLILILGVGYKTGSSDTRESPAEKIILEIESRGAKCQWLDPLVSEWHFNRCQNLKAEFDGVVLVTYQVDMDFSYFIEHEIPVLDCSYKFIKGFYSI
jgi:UDP-N-acetyl-D-glucosamine dehydrogenase